MFFVDGPLVEALRHGSLLYVEELNRVPEETVNLLITVMSEGELTLPRLGTIPAAVGFRLVAAMNPFDNIGTARVSGASMTACVASRWDTNPSTTSPTSSCGTLPKTIESCGAGLSPSHAVLATTPMCASVHPCAGDRSGRGGPRTAPMRSAQVTDPSVGLDAALTALSGRIRLHEGEVPRPSRSSPTCGTRCSPRSTPVTTTTRRREKRPPRTGRLRRPPDLEGDDARQAIQDDNRRTHDPNSLAIRSSKRSAPRWERSTTTPSPVSSTKIPTTQCRCSPRCEGPPIRSLPPWRPPRRSACARRGQGGPGSGPWRGRNGVVPGRPSRWRPRPRREPRWPRPRTGHR